MMNRNTGGHIAAPEHLRQSVLDILTTPIGSRVMRRDYGSLLPALIDQPSNSANVARVAAAAAAALMRWEPRLGLVRITTQRTEVKGRMQINVAATVQDLAGVTRPITLAVDMGENA